MITMLAAASTIEASPFSAPLILAFRDASRWRRPYFSIRPEMSRGDGRGARLSSGFASHAYRPLMPPAHSEPQPCASEMVAA